MDDLIAVRIKDGLFAGNSGAAMDKTFLMMNKISHIVNCAGAEVGDIFLGEPGFSYLTFPWKDAAGSVCTTILFDAADDNINRTVRFIDEALNAGECVLVHSVYGKSRSPALIVAYLMVKYGWKLESALLYLNMAHPDADIKPHFQRQLRQFAKRHDTDRDVFSKDVDDSHFGLDNDQWMLRNTFLNGLLYDSQVANDLYKQCTGKVDVGVPVTGSAGAVARPRITFVDTKKGTDVESQSSCLVVNSTTPFHADPASSEANGFIGRRGTSSLRAPRRSPSILSRSTSPCERHLESDPRTSPKGRQTLVIVHNGLTETLTSTSANKGERPPVLRPGGATVSRTHSSSSQLSDRTKAKGKDGEAADSFLAQPRQSSLESTRSIDYSRLAPPPSQVRSPFATLASSHKYRNGSPLPLPKDKKEPSSSKGTRTKISSTPSAQALSTHTSPPPVTPPSSASAARLVNAVNAPERAAARPTSAATTPAFTAAAPSARTGSPFAAAKPAREVVVGRPSVAGSYRGIAPSRSAASSRAPDTVPRSTAVPRTASRTASPSKQSSEHGSDTLNGSSRRRTLSPVHHTTRAAPSIGSSGAKVKHSSTCEEKDSGRSRSPKPHKSRETSSRQLNDSFSSANSNSHSSTGAATKNRATVHRQLPPAIASRRAP